MRRHLFLLIRINNSHYCMYKEFLSLKNPKVVLLPYPIKYSVVNYFVIV